MQKNQIQQPSSAQPITPAKSAAAITAALALALSLIMPWEGKRNDAYLDVAKIPTICYGATRNLDGTPVVLGQHATDVQCNAMLLNDAYQHGSGIAQCIKVEVPRESLAAFVSFSYNVGTGAFCRSTLNKKLHAGDLAGACAELMKWTTAGGKVRQGLVNRRTAERQLCLRGLTPPPTVQVPRPTVPLPPPAH